MNSTPEQELEGILGTFGSEYEWPYRFMKDLNRTPADQQVEAQKLLIRETATKLTELFESELATRVEEAVQIVNKYSIHAAKGAPKGTLARRKLINSLRGLTNQPANKEAE